MPIYRLDFFYYTLFGCDSFCILSLKDWRKKGCKMTSKSWQKIDARKRIDTKLTQRKTMKFHKQKNYSVFISVWNQGKNISLIPTISRSAALDWIHLVFGSNINLGFFRNLIQGFMARGGHELPKVSSRPAMPDPPTPYRRATHKTALWPF